MYAIPNSFGFHHMIRAAAAMASAYVQAVLRHKHTLTNNPADLAVMAKFISHNKSLLSIQLFMNSKFNHNKIDCSNTIFIVKL